ncbi:hypothetical protein LH704_21095 [Burkholderia cenocepacia]|uniref:hypothetical protein n=1 Tax=Burkholderia cenocepacia TaxID=95486 RepID=UPI001F3D114A|nr:hypothetical protein [Burkholderia cenocepacia]MCF1369267.1 hypothetical protein [Burkholderia cenocepacia]MCF1386702.1 hypothetical protein [Burkholderia cenocepacia]
MLTEFHILRSATLKGESELASTRALPDWRNLDAYVLLGEPGSGKTVAFQMEARAMGEDAHYITVRDLVTVGLLPSAIGKTLFIDALDERRTDSISSLTSLDDVRRALQSAGRPRFRLSCREADWIRSGTADLVCVSPSDSVETLWLEPLNEAEITELLTNLGPGRVENPNNFLEEADRRRLTPLLGNPLLLNLLVDAVKDGRWPDSRSETYAAACVMLAREHNETRRMMRSSTQNTSPSRITSTAGKLLAVMLVANCTAIYIGSDGVAPDGSFHIDELPDAFAPDRQTMLVALDSKLFVSDGNFRRPVHRTIGEYLAGRVIGELVSRKGLPLQRVLAVISGADFQTVDPLRGLYAWMASECPQDRELLIVRDPLGLILYGDVHPFSVGEKTKLLTALRNEGSRLPWLRHENWEAHPFAALGTGDMSQVFAQYLESDARDVGHEAVLDCILDAIHYGEPFPALSETLERMARDDTHPEKVRVGALTAWLKDSNFSVDGAKAFCTDVLAGRIADDHDELIGVLLDRLYPDNLSTAEALAFCRPPKQPSLIGRHRMFWAVDFMRRLPLEDVPRAADFLANILSTADAHDDEDVPEQRYEGVRELAEKVLIRAVLEYGSIVDVTRLYTWLTVGLDKYGTAVLSTDAGRTLGEWFGSRPELQKEIFLEAVSRVRVEPRDGRYHYGMVDECLFRAKKPRDWFSWLLAQATSADEEDFARHCVQSVAYAAVNMASDFDIDLEKIEDWIEENDSRWPSANEWKIEQTAWALDSYQRREYRRKRDEEARRAGERNERQLRIAPQLSALYQGTGNPGLLRDIGLAYRGLFYDIKGDTGADRVRSLLVVSGAEALRAVAGLKLVLLNFELPSFDDILSLNSVRKVYTIGSAALLAAELAMQDDPSTYQTWSIGVVESLVGFHLVESISSKPEWFLKISVSRPQEVARLVSRYWRAQANAAPRTEPLYFLRERDAPLEFVQHVLPELFRDIAPAPDERLFYFLTNVLLTAAVRHLAPETRSNLLRSTLRRTGLSVEVEVAMRVELLDEPESEILLLEQIVWGSPRGPLLLAEALQRQDGDFFNMLRAQAAIVGRVISLLAIEPTSPSSVWNGEPPSLLSGAIDRLLRLLSESASVEAEAQLLRLRGLSSMDAWHVPIDGFLFEQRRLARNAKFTAPAPAAVARMLANGAPANSRDMAELLRDHLIHFARRIQFEETNWLDLFYESDGKGGEKPKNENACRDILLGLLRDRVVLQHVQLEKESVAAAEKRADMQATVIVQSERRISPVEIKKDSHKEVWSAWRDQLEPRYLRNPAAGGVGMYLVLWFGHKTKVGPDGQRPRSAQEMAESLNALIPAEYTAHIVGLVIDLSRQLSRP